MGRECDDGSSELYVTILEDTKAAFFNADSGHELATTLGFKSSYFDDGAYLCSMNPSTDFTYSKPSDLGANYYWALGLRTSGGKYEAVVPRMTEVSSKEAAGIMSFTRK